MMLAFGNTFQGVLGVYILLDDALGAAHSVAQGPVAARVSCPQWVVVPIRALSRVDLRETLYQYRHNRDSREQKG